MNEFKPDYILPKDPNIILGFRAIEFLAEEENIYMPTVFEGKQICICCENIGFHDKHCLHLSCLDVMNKGILPSLF